MISSPSVPAPRVVCTLLPNLESSRYVPIAILDIFWRDLHRPELFWRTFEPVTDYDREREGVV